MNADRHALLAALEYSGKQEQEINLLHHQMAEIQQNNRELRQQLRGGSAWPWTGGTGRRRNTAPARGRRLARKC